MTSGLLAHRATGFIASKRCAALRISFSTNSPMKEKDAVVKATQRWFQDVVIGQKLCPFAPPLLAEPQRIRIVHSNSESTQDAVSDVKYEVERLMQKVADGGAATTHHETTLVAFGNKGPFVSDFREFVRLSWELQEKAVGDHLNDLQLVLFHPRATHQTYGEMGNENPADYTIRSPFPTVHLLREVDAMKAVTSGYPNLETLSSRNQSRMIKHGLEMCQTRLDDCYR